MMGLMQDVPLTVDRILDHAANWHGGSEVVSREAKGRVTRSTYAAIHADAKRVSNALTAEGIMPGDRVATMGWNSARHRAAWCGPAGMGVVLRTLNPRLFLEQIACIANHGGSACPESIIRTFRDDYGVDVTLGWGTTETSPLGTVSVPNTSVAAKPDEEQMSYKLKQGRLHCGLEMKLVDDDGCRTTAGRAAVPAVPAQTRRQRVRRRPQGLPRRQDRALVIARRWVVRR